MFIIKKLLFTLLLSILSFGVIACTNSEDLSTSTNAEKEVTKKKENSENVSVGNDEEGENSENVSGENNAEEEEELEDTVLNTDNYDFKLIEIEQISGKYDDKQLLALEIEFTNNSDSTKSPWMAIATKLKANQETDDTVELLNGGNGRIPDDYKPELVEMGDKKVKSGKTVDAVVSFEIKYPGDPVYLIDFNLTDEAETFERIVDTESVN